MTFIINLIFKIDSMNGKTLWYETLYNHFGQYFSIDSVIYQEKNAYYDLIMLDLIE